MKPSVLLLVITQWCLCYGGLDLPCDSESGCDPMLQIQALPPQTGECTLEQKLEYLDQDVIRVRNMITSNREEIQNLDKIRLKRLQELSEILKESAKTLQKTLHNEFCKVSYRGKCFWLVQKPDTTYSRAKSICLKHNGVPANIYDIEHYQEIVEYIRPYVPWPLNWIWLGMKYYASNERVELYNGTIVEFVEWRGGYPVGDQFFPTYDHLTLEVRQNPNARYKGMRNSDPYISWDGVLCESLH